MRNYILLDITTTNYNYNNLKIYNSNNYEIIISNDYITKNYKLLLYIEFLFRILLLFIKNNRKIKYNFANIIGCILMIQIGNHFACIYNA